MFTLEDMGTFSWAFFVTLPLTMLIHALGHSFFAYLFGGKVTVTIGRGGKLLRLSGVEVRKFYFVDSACSYGDLRRDRRWKHALIYAGGPLFNVISIFVVNGLIHAGVWEPKLFFYQFVYFSVYFVFFSIIPIDYGENNPSDGKAIYDALRHGKIYRAFQ